MKSKQCNPSTFTVPRIPAIIVINTTWMNMTQSSVSIGFHGQINYCRNVEGNNNLKSMPLHGAAN